MRANQTIVHTLREDPKDAVVASHRLMLRAGLVQKLGTGLYHFLPMGLRIFRKIESVVREEMNNIGALEFQTSILTPAELWQKSGRWDAMGKELFRLQDRHNNWNLLGPTHEETFTYLFKDLLKSHKDLPKIAYQIHAKLRDEIRPRFGMIRAREFIMKDAYSFHLSETCLDKTYNLMRFAYRRIFTRLGLNTILVEADSGNMGGMGSEEFMVASQIGEEMLLISENEKYRSNSEKTPVLYKKEINVNQLEASKNATKLEKLYTPNVKSIGALANTLQVEQSSILKAVAYTTNNKFILIFIRADREINELKVRNYLKSKVGNKLAVDELKMAKQQEISLWGLHTGFIGPLGLPMEKNEKTKQKEDKTLLVLWDNSIKTREKWYIGSNQKDYHYRNYVWDPKNKTEDFALARTGDPAPNGDGFLKEMPGIEVGHIFKLGHKYAKYFDMTVLDDQSNSRTPLMGCYGIGINRVMATIIEQYHDKKGIFWPISVAPYEIVLIGITNSKSKEENWAVESFYQLLKNSGCEVFWDDRDLRPGAKFIDSELIGYPIRITMGKNYFSSGKLEVQLRKNDVTLSFEGDQKKLCQKIVQLKEKLHKEMRVRVDSLVAVEA